MSVSVNLLPANTSGMETDASGWAAGSNTTLARSTARFYSGAASLQLTATAAGSVTATTSARVAVTAGTVYTAYAYAANATAVVGRAVTVTVSWYALVTGGSALGTSASAAVTLPGTTAWFTPPAVLIATAPTGAAYASVTITVSGLTAGTAVGADVISFGPPNLLAGNLLPYNTQGCEVDASGWQSVWNATTSKSSSVSFEGWCSLAVTTTATGAVRAGMVASVPVDAGTEYLAYVWVFAPVSSAEMHAQIRWYDGAGTLLSISAQTWTLSASTWTRCAATGVAPVGATAARIMLEPVATTTGQVWYFDQMLLRPAPVMAGNLLTYNEQSIELDTSGWTASSGCTVSRSLTNTWEGVSSLRITADGTGDAVVNLARDLPVEPRQAYKIIPLIYHATTVSQSVSDLLFTWYDSSGSMIQSFYYRWTTGTAAGWYAPTGSAVAPSGAATLNVGIRIVNPAAGQTFYADNILVGPGGLGVVADPIEGAYGTSITIQGLTTGGFSYWGLWRMMDDGTMTPVRGSDGDLAQVTITGDLAVVEDYESPLGLPATYYARVWTPPSGYYLYAASDALTLPEPEETMVVIKDPGSPARWTTAVVAKGGMPDWTRSARQGVNPVRGRARPIVISDVRTSRVGSMSLVTETAEELAAMWWLLETGNTLLIQWPSEWGESDVYVQVGDVTEAHVADYASYLDRTWSIPLTDVDRPVGGITGSADRTWQTVLDSNADWLSVLAGADNWLDVYTGVKGG